MGSAGQEEIVSASDPLQPRARLRASSQANTKYVDIAMLGMNIYFGALLAELSNRLPSPSITPQRNPLVRTMTVIVLLLGLHVSGYPEVSPEWTSWSQNLAQIGKLIFPGKDYWRYWTSVGAQLITLAVVISPGIQELLSHPSLVWLGSVSLPLYLIHGPLVRSLLAWMLFGWQKPVSHHSQDVPGTRVDSSQRRLFPDRWVFCIVLPVFLLILLWASHLWTTWVEPWCASMTKRIEGVMCGTEEGEKGELPRTNGCHGEKFERPRSNGILDQV